MTSTPSPTEAIREALDNSFIHVDRLPGNRKSASQAAGRAARRGELIPVRSGLYYKGVATRYGMTAPNSEEVAREILGPWGGFGAAGYSAARVWGVTTQVPAEYHAATLRCVAPIRGVQQHGRSNQTRGILFENEIALLELLRNPDVNVEAGLEVLARNVGEATAAGEVRWDIFQRVVRGERLGVVRANFARLDALIEGVWL